jgi:hypothetical protein
MSKGNPKIQIRLTVDDLALIESSIHSANLRRPDVPYDVSSWVRHAIREKLDKLRRSTKATRRKKSKEEGVYYTPPSDGITSSEPSFVPLPAPTPQSLKSACDE